MKEYKITFRYTCYNISTKQNRRIIGYRIEQGKDVFDVMSRVSFILEEYQNAELLGIMQIGI